MRGRSPRGEKIYKVNVMKYLLKNSVFGFVYLLVMDFVAILIYYVDNRTLQIILSFVAVAFYCFVVGYLTEKEGETALDVLHNNDMERRHVIKTGILVDINTAAEYKPYKGFCMGLLICSPLLLLLLIHLILGLASGGTINGAGTAASLGYFLFYAVYGSITSLDKVLTFGEYFILLYAPAVTSITMGVAYIIGANKSRKKYLKIEIKHREIYGDET